MAQNARPSSQLLLKFVISIFCKKKKNKKKRQVKQQLVQGGGEGWGGVGWGSPPLRPRSPGSDSGTSAAASSSWSRRDASAER